MPACNANVIVKPGLGTCDSGLATRDSGRQTTSAMKKPAVILLILSLLANLALALVVVRTNALSTLVLGPQKNSPAQTRAGGRPQASDSAIISAVKAGDAGALLALLKNTGLDDKAARLMAASVEFRKLADQIEALRPDTPYWRNSTQTPAERLKQQQAMLSFGLKMRDLLADAFPQVNGNKYSYLTPERRAQILSMQRDYDDITAETYAASSGFRLQSDTDKLKALADERKREIDSFLTPDEIAARDMRESPAAKLLRNDYGNVIDNEADYQAAYAIMQSAGDDTDAGRAQVEALLGPERMAKLAQMNDPDYALIQSAAARLNLPADATTASLMDIRDQARQATETIAGDGTLTSAQRKAALQDLAAKSQEQMSGVLGAEGAAAFAKSSKWMGALKRGSTFSYDAKGKFQSK